MSKKTFKIVWTIIMIWPLIGSFFFPPAIPVVVAIYFIVLKFPKDKDDLRKLGEKTRGAIEYLGTMAEEAGKTGAVLSYYGGVVIKGTVEEFYKRIGGEEGAKRILNTLGKFSEEVGKTLVEAAIVGGKVIAEVSEYTKERIEQEKTQRLDESDRNLLDEYVEWKIIDEN